MCVCDYADDGCICIIRVDLTVCKKLHVHEEKQNVGEGKRDQEDYFDEKDGDKRGKL